MRKLLPRFLIVAISAILALCACAPAEKPDYGQNGISYNDGADDALPPDGTHDKQSSGYGFDAEFYDYISPSGAFYTKIDITNNSGKDYTDILLTLSFVDDKNKQLFSYDAGCYVNFDKAQTHSLYLENFGESLKSGTLESRVSDVKIISLTYKDADYAALQSTAF